MVQEISLHVCLFSMSFSIESSLREYHEFQVLLHLWSFENINLLRIKLSQKIIKMAEGGKFCFILEGHLYSFPASWKRQPSQPTKKQWKYSLHSHPRDWTLLPSNSDRWFTLTWMSHTPWGPINNTRMVHFPMSEWYIFQAHYTVAWKGSYIILRAKLFSSWASPFLFSTSSCLP